MPLLILVLGLRMCIVKVILSVLLWRKLRLFHIIIEWKFIYYFACGLEISLSRTTKPSTYVNHGFDETRTQNPVVTSRKNNCFGYTVQDLKNQKSWYMFFVNLITCLRTRSCTSNSRLCTCVCQRLPRCAPTTKTNILEQKVNLMSIPFTISPEPSLGIQAVFYRKRKNTQVSCPKLNQTRTKQLSVNCV